MPKTEKKTGKVRSIESRAKEALEFAREKAKTCETWIDLHNAVFGIGGKFVQLFPSQSERVAFTQRPEYAQIRAVIRSLPKPETLPIAANDEPSGNFTLRLPRSVHAALAAEAESEGVSLNQLCLAKLAVQLRAEVR